MAANEQNSQAPSSVKLTDISITYKQNDREQQIVSDLDLAIGGGEIVVLSGRSGSGKSSLLNICYGFQKPTAGQVFWYDENIAELSEKRRQTLRREKFGVCSQEVQVLDSLTALQNVMLGGASEENAKQYLTALGLGDYLRKPVKLMSGGERQRVQVARAMAKHPDVLILDEPTSALDIVAAKAVSKLLQEAKERGVAIVLGTHDDVLLQIADRVVKL